MANNIQLLIDLGVDSTSSKNNINNYIKELKGLENVKVQLDVDGFSSANKSFDDLQKQIAVLQRQLDTLAGASSKFTDGFDSKKVTDGLDEIERKVNNTSGAIAKSSLANLDKELISNLRSLDEVYDYLNSKQIKFRIDENSKNEVTRVTAQLQNELGQLESVTIKPKYFEGTSVLSDFNVSSSLTDSNTFKLNDSLTASLNKLKDLESQGLITGQVMTEFGQNLTKATTNSEIDKITADFTRLAREISEMDSRTIALQKFNAELDKMSRQGLIDEATRTDFIDQSNLVKTIKELQVLQGTLKSVASEADFDKTINNAINNIQPNLDRLNTRLDLALSKLGSNIDTTALDNVRVKMEQLANVNITNTEDINKFNVDVANAEKAITQLTTVGNSNARFEDALARANQELLKLERNGYASSSSIESFKNDLKNIPTGDLEKVKNLTSDIKTELEKVQYARSIETALARAGTALDNVDAQLEKTKRLYASSFDSNVLAENKNLIDGIREDINVLNKALDSGNIGDITKKRLDSLSASISAMNARAKEFNATATLAGRNSVGFLQALETAFTKFPIWMIASSTFFGAIRGVQDLTEKVIELDTAMTNLIRVADGDQFEFNNVIERAIDDTTELSGKLTEFMELVTEFARTGKTIDESFDLANTTQALVNISDLDAGQAVDSLTAAMISFNIEAEDSIRIADKLNEVDNNFSITTLDLSQSLNKAASTASTFGRRYADLGSDSLD